MNNKDYVERYSYHVGYTERDVYPADIALDEIEYHVDPHEKIKSILFEICSEKYFNLTLRCKWCIIDVINIL